MKNGKFSNLNDRAISFEASNKDTNELLVEYCSFSDNINIPKYASAIFFYEKGQCVLNRICGFNCNATGGYSNFLAIVVSKSSDYKNFFNYSSIYSVNNEHGYYNSQFINGNFTMSNTNITRCTLYGPSGFQCERTSSILCQFSTIEYCSSPSTDIILCLEIKGISKIKNCNIMNNHFEYSLMRTSNSNSLTVEDCVLIGNHEGPLFYAQSSKFVIIHCYISDNVGQTAANDEDVNLESASTKFFHNFNYIGFITCYNEPEKLNVPNCINEESLEVECKNRQMYMSKLIAYISLLPTSMQE